jgi:WhiB family redox-sensing transcriptional regulator
MFAWMEKGRCRTEDRDLFFPNEGERDKVKKARKICARCPVRARCLQHALEYDENGIWGNTTDYERRQIRLALAS